MPRKRTIAPGFFKNEDLGACSPLARLLFAGMWCWADREGRLEDRPRRIKAEILPYDDGVDGEQLVAELATHGFLDRYEVNGQRFIQILHFDTYQDPHPNETKSVIPARNGGGEPLVLPRSTKDQPPEDQGEPKEASSKARPSCPSRPSQPSRPARSLDGGGRAELGPLGQALVARVSTGLGKSLVPLASQDLAEELEARIERHGGVEACVAYVAQTVRHRDVEPEGVKLVLLWLRDLEAARDTG